MFLYFCPTKYGLRISSEQKIYRLNKLLFIPAFFFYSLFLFAQHADSSKNSLRAPVAEFFQEEKFFPGHSAFEPIDSSLDNIQKYFPNNFPYSLGIAKRNLFFEHSSEIGFISGFENLDLFGYNNEKIKYYKVLECCIKHASPAQCEWILSKTNLYR